MNYFLECALHDMMFRPPARDGARFKQDSHNVMVKSMGGNCIHCRLVNPYDAPCSLADFMAVEHEDTLFTIAEHGQSAGKQLILFMHGNADDLDSCKSYCSWMADHLGVSVLSFDYPGYGHSSGVRNTSQENMIDAAVSAFDYATTKLAVRPASILLVGKSIGSYAAIGLAALPFASRVKGLVLISPVASAVRCVISYDYLPSFLMRRLDSMALGNIDKIKQVSCMMLFVHGRKDEVVPCENSHDLIARASIDSYYPPLFVDAGHNDIESKFPSIFVSTVQEFLATCTAHSTQAESRRSVEDYSYEFE